MHQSKTENTGFDLILKVLIGSYFLFLIPDFHYSSFELSYYYLKNKITIKLQMFSTSISNSLSPVAVVVIQFLDKNRIAFPT